MLFLVYNNQFLQYSRSHSRGVCCHMTKQNTFVAYSILGCLPAKHGRSLCSRLIWQWWRTILAIVRTCQVMFLTHNDSLGISSRKKQCICRLIYFGWTACNLINTTSIPSQEDYSNQFQNEEGSLKSYIF